MPQDGIAISSIGVHLWVAGNAELCESERLLQGLGQFGSHTAICGAQAVLMQPGDFQPWLRLS